jgi:hypothetical protein
MIFEIHWSTVTSIKKYRDLSHCAKHESGHDMRTPFVLQGTKFVPQGTKVQLLDFLINGYNFAHSGSGESIRGRADAYCKHSC